MNKINSFLSLTCFFLIFGVCITGCSDSITNSVTTPDKYKANTEAEFNASASLKAIPGAVVYVSLEHINTPADSVNGDTGGIGEDVIPYSYTETAIHHIKLGPEAQFKARLVNEAGSVIYQLNNPGDTARVSLASGNYKLYLTSTINYAASTGSTSQPVFIQRDIDAINSAAGAPPQGGYSKDDLNTLLTTRKCTSCNLDGIQLHGNDLSGVQITNSGMNHAFLERVNLTGGTLTNVDWTDGAANNCNFAGVHFNNVMLYRSSFDHGYFVNSVFQHILWDRTHFITGDFRNATLDSGSAYNGSVDGSDFNHANISNLDWHEVSAQGAKFVNVTFSKVSCYTVYFAEVVMDSSKFINKCFFQLSQFRDSKIRYATFTDFRGDGSLFAPSDMRGTRITDAFFGGGSFRAAILINAVWNNVQIPAVNMCHQDRTGAVFNNISKNPDTDCWP